MLIFRAFLATLWLVLLAYTAVVVSNHGMGLLAVFFGDIATMAWAGQFNLDFLFMLSLSALWVFWRHQFSSLRPVRLSPCSRSSAAPLFLRFICSSSAFRPRAT